MDLWAGLIFIALIVSGIIALFSFRNRSNRINSVVQELEAFDKLTVGQYMSGLPNANCITELLDCAIVETDYVFLSSSGTVIGKIPRNAINNITISKEQKKYYVNINWDDSSGMNWNTILNTYSELSSNQVMNFLTQYIKQKVTHLKTTEKKCPYCAEIIKKEAKICRFCGRESES